MSSPSSDPRVATGAAYWAGLTVDAALAALGTGQDGLGASDVADRRARFGPNELPRALGRPWYVELAGNFVHLFAILLWAGAALAWVAGMPELGWAIVVVILVNGLFSFWQEYQAERAAQALVALLPTHVTVRRERTEQLVPARDIVPGDILILTEGERVPADARVTVTNRLRLDTACLTGESRPVPRSAAPVTAAPSPALLPNIVFAGTTIASGRGEAAVFATGVATEFGRLAQLTQVQAERPSPLQRELRRITRLVTVLAVTMGVVSFVVGTVLAGLPPVAGFLFAVGIIVANVPEGLLPTLTLALAVGVRRMAGRNALVKRLSAVETLGATTVILTDKTGTLTENEMTVRHLWVAGRSYRVIGTGYEPSGCIEPLEGAADLGSIHALLRAAALCCDARLLPPDETRRLWVTVGDPTEAAILVAAAKAGLSREVLDRWPRLAELPFDSTRRRMTTVQDVDGAAVACVKGAPSEVLPRCTSVLWDGCARPFDQALRQRAQEAHDGLASRGLRVLAVAERSGVPRPTGHAEPPADMIEQELTLLGLLAMEDPPRPEVPAALDACHRAGVRVIMVTGDNGLTAAAISAEIGMHRGTPRVITGATLDRLNGEQLDAVLEVPHVLFARANPEHKLRLVEALQRRGEVVAVTGDGVNDAPALKRADIGVAMGITGTDVAREAADMVLSDDNFASIVAAIEEGRSVYDNVRKFLTYILASNVPEMVPFVAFVLFRIPLPLTVMQILAVDLGTDLLPALALGREGPEPDVMRRQPRRRSERLLNRGTLLRAYAWLGTIEAALSLAGFFFVYWLTGWRPGLPMPGHGTVYVTATTMSLAGIVAAQIGNAFACRSSRESILRVGWFTNRLLLAGIAVELALLLLLMHWAPAARIFGLAPLSGVHWLLLAGFGPTLLVCDEVRKALLRWRFDPRWSRMLRRSPLSP